jgi:hypothetical protein
MKNFKRQGVWVNVLTSTTVAHRPAWDPVPALQATPTHRPPPRPSPPAPTPAPPRAPGADTSESAREWGWVCGALEAGVSPQTVYRQLVERASQRRGRDAERYARHTIDRALRHVR